MDIVGRLYPLLITVDTLIIFKICLKHICLSLFFKVGKTGIASFILQIQCQLT